MWNRDKSYGYDKAKNRAKEAKSRNKDLKKA